MQLHEGAERYYEEARPRRATVLAGVARACRRALAGCGGGPVGGRRSTARAAPWPGRRCPADGRFALTYRHSVYRPPPRNASRPPAAVSCSTPSPRGTGACSTTTSSTATARARATWVLHPDAAPRFHDDAARRDPARPAHARHERRARAPVRRSRPSAAGGQSVTKRGSGRQTKTLLEEYEPERPGRKLEGFPARLVRVLGAGLALFAIFWVFWPLAPQVYRPAFLAVALVLTFVAFGRAKQPTAADYVVAVLALLAVGYAVVTPDLVRRAARPETLDIVFGVAAILAGAGGHAAHDGLGAARDLPGVPVLRVLRRAAARLDADRPQGLRDRPDRRPVVHGAGGHLRRAARRGRDLHRPVRDLRRGPRVQRRCALLRRDLVRRLRALADRPGAHERARPASCSAPCPAPASPPRSRSGPSPGRCCARPGTRRTRAAASWPRAGIGAILSPPTLGAAAFIIAEILEVSYLQVLVYALIPSILYYVGILMAIEADARRHRGPRAATSRRPASGRLLARWATTSRSCS